MQALLTLKWLDALYVRVAHRPRLLIAAGAALGLGCAFGVTAGRLAWPEYVAEAAASPPAPSARPYNLGDPLAVVGAYNAASIAAAASGDAALVLPFFADGSREPDAIRSEFDRRAARDELHRPTLVRWGVAEQHVDGGNATVVTQEVWDDQVYRNGARVDSRRGTTLRIRYTLSRHGAAAPWRIRAIHSSTVVP